MLALMNSAMMPVDGIYVRKTINAGEFRRIFQQYQDDYKSYIGYPNACRVLSNLLDKKIALCRDETVLKAGDIILAARLRYRVDPSEKSTRKHGNDISDYELLYITYMPL